MDSEGGDDNEDVVVTGHLYSLVPSLDLLSN